MPLKAVPAASLPSLDQLHGTAVSVSQSPCPVGAAWTVEPGRFLVVGHRGKGMNALTSADRRLKEIKENSIASFNAAACFAIQFVEFDVQVTRDDCPIIFHDDTIIFEEKGEPCERRVTELSLEEFLACGPQREEGKIGKRLLRRTRQGGLLDWTVERDDPSCTLQEAFEHVDDRLGFNVELKFDDNIAYRDDELIHVLQVVLGVVDKYAKSRPVFFSSFQPDAARLIRKLQNVYPVFFLTTGGTEKYADVRRNSLEEAIKHCLANGLQGIVSEVKGVFRNPSAVASIKQSNLALLTYGTLNNVPESVYMQHLMGVNGVIVDLVKEISEAVTDFSMTRGSWPQFSPGDLSFLLRLVPELAK